MLARELRTPRERTLFLLSAIFSSIVWLLLLISIVGIIYGLIFGALALVVHCLFMAHVIGNGVRVGPRQLPDLMRRIEAAAHKLGLDRVPEAYVLQAGGLLNAFATKILSRRFLIIYSDLLEASDSQNGDGDGAGSEHPNELDFVIGHELGHVAAGHLATRLFLLPARVLPLLGPAYSRACEYTCDRCGHAAAGDLTVSSRALAILAAGPKTARRIDLDAYVDQQRETGRFWMGIYELNATHPFLSKRVAALRRWQGQGALESIGRNPLSYLLAPLFGLAGGGPQSALLIIVAVIGIAAAIAIPRFKQQMGLGGGSTGHGYKYDPDRADPFAPVDRAPDRAPDR
jgi:Zn-dependent protease with chaperone function